MTDQSGMEASRDENRLVDVRGKIEALYIDRGDNFNLPARYEALVKLETILLEKVNGPLDRRARELSLLGR